MIITGNNYTTNANVNAMNKSNSVNLNGEDFTNGLMVKIQEINEYNDIVFDISDNTKKGYALFSALAGAEEDEDVSYRFIVLVDGEVRYISLLYNKNNGILPVYADISGGKELTLRIIKQYCRDNKLPYRKDWKPSRAYWCMPSLLKAMPEMLPPRNDYSQWLYLVNQSELIVKPDLYCLTETDKNGWEIFECYDTKNYKGNIFIFKSSGNDANTLKLKGLDSDGCYNLSFANNSGQNTVCSGNDLINKGIEVILNGDNQTEIIYIELLSFSAENYSGGEKKTAEIQALFDKAITRGVSLRFTQGDYHFGRINLIGVSGINIIVEKGAYIHASQDYRDYGNDGWCNGFFYIRNCSDIKISGEGVIDGMDCFDPKGEEGFRGAHLINYTGCNDIDVSGVTFKNSGNYTNAVFACKNARFTNLIVEGGHNAVQYQDCENIYIGNCKFITGDDCIAGAEGRNITVENCELNTSCNGFRLGGSDVTIRNVHIYGPGKYEHKVQKRNNMLSGFTYFAPANWGSTVYGDNWNISDVTVENADRFFIFDYISGFGGWQDGMPLRNIVFNNVKATGILAPTVFKGAPNNKIKIEMRNVSLTYKNMESMEPFELENVDEFIQDNLIINRE